MKKFRVLIFGSTLIANCIKSPGLTQQFLLESQFFSSLVAVFEGGPRGIELFEKKKMELKMSGAAKNSAKKLESGQ